MYKIIKDEKIADKVYTIRGKALGTPTDIRYIQRSWSSNRPIISTRIAYTFYKLIVFESVLDAEMFLMSFVNSESRRNEYDIDWKIVEYKGKCDKKNLIIFKEVKDPEYGRYCVPERVLRSR